MIRFYAPDIETEGCLPADESSHCARVLRRHEGDEVEVVDGKGFAYTCRIADANPRRVALEVVGKRSELPHWGRKITLAVAPTKNADRMEWLAEKVVEMGIDRLVLLRTEHSERKVLKTDRLRRVMVSAMKQSLKATLPELSELTDFSDFLAFPDSSALQLIAHCEDDKPRVPIASRVPAPGQDVVVLIGPEGDFSPEEIAAALEAGFVPVTMGRSRLRTETAAIFAIAALHTLIDNNVQCTMYNVHQ